MSSFVTYASDRHHTLNEAFRASVYMDENSVRFNCSSFPFPALGWLRDKYEGQRMPDTIRLLHGYSVFQKKGFVLS